MNNVIALPNGTVSAYSGLLLFTRIAADSKQDHMGPILQLQEGNVRLYVKGDNPFENNQLKDFEGKQISVFGKWKNSILIIKRKSIKVCEDHTNSN